MFEDFNVRTDSMNMFGRSDFLVFSITVVQAPVKTTKFGVAPVAVRCTVLPHYSDPRYDEFHRRYNE